MTVTSVSQFASTKYYWFFAPPINPGSATGATGLQVADSLGTWHECTSYTTVTPGQLSLIYPSGPVYNPVAQWQTVSGALFGVTPGQSGIS